MSDMDKHPEVRGTTYTDDTAVHREEDVPEVQLPPGIKYRSIKLGPLRIPYYASPKAQLLLVAFTCFLCPGMFNALNGMGGGGQLDTETANAANAALYAAFAVVAFFAGSITNWLGIKVALSMGGLGYSLYVASFLSYNYDMNRGFCIFAGIVLGICAGLLWTAQGAIMMSYPKEASKGRYISWFWIIFNFGGVIGGLVSHKARCSGHSTNVGLRSLWERTFIAPRPPPSATGPTLGSWSSPSAVRALLLV